MFQYGESEGNGTIYGREIGAGDEMGGENNVGAKDGSDNNEADDTKGGKEWGAIRWSKPETTTKMTTKKRK